MKKTTTLENFLTIMSSVLSGMATSAGIALGGAVGI